MNEKRNEKLKRVAIIGGGITGLTIAHALEQHNRDASEPIDYVLIERNRRLGGKVITENDIDFLSWTFPKIIIP